MIQEFETIAKKIQADFERTKRIPHQPTKGTARERFVTSHFLDEYLPKKYSVGSGLIADSKGNFSKQQDLIVYDGFNFPVMQDLQDNKLFFAEQVFATIEVKSTLNNDEIVDILYKASSVASLQRVSTYRLYTVKENLEAHLSPNIFFFGFVYESKISLTRLRDIVQTSVKDSGKHWGISGLVVLSDTKADAGLITNIHPIELNTLKIIPSLDSPIASIKCKSQGEALFSFYLLLMQALQIAEASATAPDYLAYAKTAGLGTIDIDIGKIGSENLPLSQAIEILRRAHLLPDKPIIDAYALIVQQITNLGIIDNPYNKSNTLFQLGEDKLIKDPRPRDIWIAINHYLSGTLGEEDRNRMAQLVRLLRIVAAENTFLDIVEMERSSINEMESTQTERF